MDFLHRLLGPTHLVGLLPGYHQLDNLLHSPNNPSHPPIQPQLRTDNIQGMTLTPGNRFSDNGFNYQLPRGSTTWDNKTQNFYLRYGPETLPMISPYNAQSINRFAPLQKLLGGQ